jgi:FkbM family methyltransferase
LTGSAMVRNAGKLLRLHLAINWWLGRFPVVKTLPDGIQYRARRIESLALSVEFFDDDVLYEIEGLSPKIQTFADLGCNVGYFTCWLCHKLKTTKLKGLMVDANEDALQDARWHIEKNHLTEVHALHGLVGMGQKTGHADFFAHTSNVCSTAEPEPDTPASCWTWVQAPCLDVEDHWTRLFGNSECSLLKLDIEGSEKEFIQNETRFLKRVQTIFMEWHKRKVSLDKIKETLSSQGFVLGKILYEDSLLGTAVFKRK